MRFTNRNIARLWRHARRRGFAALEISLVLAIVLLVLLLYPNSLTKFTAALDARHWSRGDWILVNACAVFALIAIRFRREIRAFRSGGVLRLMRPRLNPRISQVTDKETDYEARCERDAEWRERARRRLPFT